MILKAATVESSFAIKGTLTFIPNMPLTTVAGRHAIERMLNVAMMLFNYLDWF